MKALRDLFVFIGLVTVIAVVWLGWQVWPYYRQFQQFDPQASTIYLHMGKTLLSSGVGPEAMVWKVPVAEGMSVEDVEQIMRFVANQHNMKDVGELPLSTQVASMLGTDYRTVKIYMFCNPLIAAQMLDYNDAYSAWLPCRITLVQDKAGKLWLYTLNMDPMIYGGKPLPPKLKAAAIGVKRSILDIMNRGASGEF